MSEVFNNMQIPLQTAQTAANVSQSVTQPVTVKEVLPATDVKDAQKSDTVELSTKEEKAKQGPVKTVKNGIANIKKFFATTNEYAKGTLKGIKNGAIAGSLIYTGGEIINFAKSKGAAKAGETAKKLPNKALAVAAGVIAVAGSLWNASLNATEKNSGIDHRWTGHNQ